MALAPCRMLEQRGRAHSSMEAFHNESNKLVKVHFSQIKFYTPEIYVFGDTIFLKHPTEIKVRSVKQTDKASQP